MLTQIKHFAFSFICLVTASVIATPTVAGDNDSQRLLGEFWSPTKSRETDTFFSKLSSKTPDVIYAYALVKSRQHAVAKAISAIEVLETIQPENPKPLRLKVWLQLRQRQFDSALVTVKKYIELNRSKTTDEQAEAFQLAGQVFGYLDGPVAYKVNESHRDRSINAILRNVHPESEKRFHAGYQEVALKFNSMMAEKKKVDQDAAVLDAKIREVKYAQLSKKEDQLHEAERRVSNERREVRRTANQTLAYLASRDVPQVYRRTALYPVGVVHGNHHYHHHSGTSHSSASHSTGHRKHKPRHFHVAGYVRGNVYGVRYRNNGFQNAFHAVNTAAANQVADLNRELKEVSKAKQRTANQKLRSLRPSGKIVTKSVALKTKARSITTYIQFPLESERQMLLAAAR